MIATFTARGVTYSARVLAESGHANPGRVEIAANGQVLAIMDFSVRLAGGPLLGGDGETAERIYLGLERALVALLVQP